MAKTTENINSKHIDGCSDFENEKPFQTNDVFYPKFGGIIDSSIKPITNQTTNIQQHQQTTINHHRNGHSRNPSSINGITIAGQTIQPPLNKPDAIQNFLQLIRFRSDECDENSKNHSKICGIREARLISKLRNTQHTFSTLSTNVIFLFVIVIFIFISIIEVRQTINIYIHASY